MIRRIRKGEKGAVWVGILIIMVFLTAIGATVSGSMVVSLRTLKHQEEIQISQALAEAAIEKAIWKLNSGDANNYDDDQVILPTGEARVSVSGDNSSKEIVATGYYPTEANYQKKRTIRVKVGADLSSSFGGAFHYGVQAGSWGVLMENNSVINGGVYSAGPVIGSNKTKALIKGGAVAYGSTAGSPNIIEGVTIGTSATHADGWSERIEDSNIWGNARVLDAGSLSGTTLLGGGQRLPWQVIPPIDMPISETTMDEWRQTAQDGPHYGGLVVNANRNLGPAYIDGNLVIETGVTVNLTGTVYVTGDISVATNSVLKLDSASFGPDDSTIIMADGKITVSSNVKICGSYSLTDCLNDVVPNGYDSYIMILSRRDSAGFSDPAIIAGNNSKAVVYYTTVGILEVSNNALLKAMTGGGIHLMQNTIVDYSLGLLNTNFTTGPSGGSWKIEEWQVLP